MTVGGDRTGRRRPRSQAHVALGAVLRAARQRAGAGTRDLGYSSGHISNVERGFVTPSRDLLEAYLGIGADPTAVQAAYERLQHEARAARDERRRRGHARPDLRQPADVGERTRPDDVRLHYAVERYDVEFDLSASGSIATVTSTADIRALTPGVRYYYTGHAPSTRVRPKDLGLRVFAGARIAHVNQTPLGTADVYLRLDRQLEPDDPAPHRLRYRVTVDDDDLADPEIQYLTRPGIRRHRLTCRFTAPAVPERIWWVESADGLTRNKIGPQNELAPSADGCYEWFFDAIVPGWTYGFVWTWPAGLRR
ncbi:MAG: XRE family transcriptional regulator [Jatrophihabitans sp.]|nr:MAG: XRE family transcriptional regulator [Jatrophihabitans sp.]